MKPEIVCFRQLLKTILFLSFLLFFVYNLHAQTNDQESNDKYTKIKFKNVFESHSFAKNLIKQINNYDQKTKEERVEALRILHIGKKIPSKLKAIVNNLYIELNRNKPENEKIKIEVMLMDPEKKGVHGEDSFNNFLDKTYSKSIDFTAEVNKQKDLILTQMPTDIDLDISNTPLRAGLVKRSITSIRNFFGVPDGVSFIAIKRVKRDNSIKKSEFALALAKTTILTGVFYSALGDKLINGEINNLMAPLIVSALDLFVFSYWQRHRLSFLKQGVEPVLKTIKRDISYFDFTHNTTFHFVGAFAISAIIRISMLGSSYITMDGVHRFFTESWGFTSLYLVSTVVFTGLFASLQSAFSKIVPEILTTRLKKRITDKMPNRKLAEGIYSGTLFAVGLLSTFAVVVGALFDASDVAKYALLAVGVMGGFVKLWEVLGGHKNIYRFKNMIRNMISPLIDLYSKVVKGTGFSAQDMKFATDNIGKLHGVLNFSGACGKAMSSVFSHLAIIM